MTVEAFHCVRCHRDLFIRERSRRLRNCCKGCFSRGLQESEKLRIVQRLAALHRAGVIGAVYCNEWHLGIRSGFTGSPEILLWDEAAALVEQHEQEEVA